MNRARPLLRLIAFLVLPLLAWPASRARAASVDDIVARHVAALGGAANVAALGSLRLVGKLTANGDFTMAWSTLVMRADQGFAMRQEASTQGLTAVAVFDGHDGWSANPFGGRREAEHMSADDAKALSHDADPAGPLANARAAGRHIEDLGEEDVDGTAALKLKVTWPAGDFDYVYLDPDSMLIVRVEGHHFQRGSESVSVTDLGNYELVGGVWIPFSLEIGAKGGPPGQQFVVERAQANPTLDPALFRFPAAGVPIVATPSLAPDAPGQVRPGSSRAPIPAPIDATTPNAPPATAVRFDAGVISGLGARNIGSAAMSGRIAAIAAVANPNGKTTVYVGAASGGVWKSTDGGTTFKPVFDRNPVQSIGAIAIDPSHPDTVWVGSGEAWTRNSVSFGDGIYKSRDGGETWQPMGLAGSERITRIVVSPRDSNVVWACVPGRLWSDSDERGLYRTKDGGATWSLVLKGNNGSTGCSSVSLDPTNPDAVLAGMWDFRRQGWTFRSGGPGPDAPSGSGLWSSADGGATWSELGAATNAGLPAKPWGRVEVVYAPSQAARVYAFIEGKDAGLFVSDDHGKTWEARDKSFMMVWRPFYFARLVVDPKEAERLFKMDLQLIVSEDGGESFSGSGGGSHGDWHDLWIDPSNTRHMIGGDDGGLWISWDGGSRWWKSDNLPVSQFYHVSLDDADPYHVYGGLQDNGSWVGDSAYPGGITSDRWESVYWGDGFWAHQDPSDVDAVYAEAQGGSIARVSRTSHSARDIQPQPGYHEKLRFNWNAPIQVSPSDKRTLYLGAQFLFRSRDRGDTWQRISPDLTTNDPAKQKQEESGGITVDNSSAEMHTTIYSISESPKNARVIWVGTDDGNLQLTRDGGATWTNVVRNVPGLPAASWVSWVEASRFDPKRAYVAFDRHTFGDFEPYVFETNDSGATWTRIASAAAGLRGYVHVIKEDLVTPSILFAGTELGLWISIDGGRNWAAFKGGDFPSVAVRDIALQARTGDVVLATHGRGIWVIDDIAPLRALSDDVMRKTVAMLPGRPAQERMLGIGGAPRGDAAYAGQNPFDDAVITYYQRARHVYGPLVLEVLDGGGKVVDTLPASKRRGVNRVTWSMHLPAPRVPRAAQLAGWSSQGPRVLPGTYTVRLTSGAESVTAPLTIERDKRVRYSDADRKAQFDAAMRTGGLFGTMSALCDRIDAARTAVEAALAAIGDATDPLAVRLAAFGAALEVAKKEIVATKEGGAVTGEERLREHADDLYGAFMLYEGRPTTYQLERIDVLARELGDVTREVEARFVSDVPGLDAELGKRNLPPIPTEAPAQAELMPGSGDVRRAIGVFFGRRAAAPERVERD